MSPTGDCPAGEVSTNQNVIAGAAGGGGGLFVPWHDDEFQFVIGSNHQLQSFMPWEEGLKNNGIIVIQLIPH